MTSRKIRIKIFEKIAQMANVPPSTPNTSTQVKQNLPPPPNFSASNAWAFIKTSYKSNSVILIDQLVDILNSALHYASNGEYNFLVLKNNNFQADPSSLPSIDGKNLLNLSLLIYKILLNSGNAFPHPVNGNQINDFVNAILKSQPLLNLSQLNPSGPIALKFKGNLKQNIANLLNYLNNSNRV